VERGGLPDILVLMIGLKNIMEKRQSVKINFARIKVLIMNGPKLKGKDMLKM